MAVKSRNKLVIIACSTGGPKALHTLVPTLDKELDAPVVIVQHMPKGFTSSLAERLNDVSEIAVSEAVNGEVLKKGHVYLARGGIHLQLKKDSSGNIIFSEYDAEPVNGLKPCANITFASVARLPLDSVVCVVLTGMGADGYEGIKSLRAKRPIYTIAQSRETCVVYGMPKVIIEKGMADVVLPLEEIGKEIIKKVGVC